MRVFGLLLCLLSLPVFSAVKVTQIHDVDLGFASDDEILVFLTSGDVAKVRPRDQQLLNQMMSEKSGTKKSWFKITMDKDRFITKVSREKAPFDQKELDFNNLVPNDETYVPTTIASMDIAKKYHKEARYHAKDSQCFNRAMVWSYEWWKKHSLKSNKILIFFTRTYIRRYNFEWWFHIAPYVHIKDGEKVVERVMDIKYTNGPRDFKQWSDIFMRNDASCPVITRYADYADYPYSGDCFYFRTSMYTYQPADLQMYDAWGYKKTSFNMDEVKGAYKEAFDENI